MCKLRYIDENVGFIGSGTEIGLVISRQRFFFTNKEERNDLDNYNDFISDVVDRCCNNKHVWWFFTYITACSFSSICSENDQWTKGYLI